MKAMLHANGYFQRIMAEVARPTASAATATATMPDRALVSLLCSASPLLCYRCVCFLVPLILKASQFTMKLSLVLCSFVASALAAPAVVWKKQEGSERRFLHSSENLAAADLMREAIQGSSFSVVFLVGKDEKGSESLTELASSGKLPATAEKYGSADSIHHHVSGVESSAVMVREASAHTDDRVLSVSMKELNQKLSSLEEVEVDASGAQAPTTSKSAGKRARQLANSNVLVVNVNPKDDAAEIDRTIAATIDNARVQSVVLTGIRSLTEVKRERNMASQQRRNLMQKEGDRVVEARRRRRLDQDGGDQGDDAAQGDNDNDMSGVYYVAMTPNILAGILFLFLFTTITYIGISCMGAISGQEVFVTKMPSVGREA
jgi:hypothetical protein